MQTVMRLNVVLLRGIFRVLIVSSLASLACFTSLSASAALISIGVLNTRDSAEDKAFWQATADYLSEQLPEHQFVIRPLGRECLTHAINKRQLDYAITNPAQVVALQKTENVHPIATLQTRYQNQTYSHFGAVVIARADRDDLQRLSDLKEQSMMAVSPTEFGGYQMIWRELLLADIVPKKDFFDILFTNGAQKNIVRAILNEQADSGVVRSGLIETMIAEGELKADQIKVIHPQDGGNYRLLHSSILYPEWTWIRLDHSDIVLSRQIASALHTMPKQNEIQKNDFCRSLWLDVSRRHGPPCMVCYAP